MCIRDSSVPMRAKQLCRLLILGSLLSGASPSSGQSAGEAATAEPVRFVTQVLEPTGGKILRPEKWHYAEGHKGPTLMWTLSSEDSTKGPYVTGVRIQAFMRVKSGTGQTAEEFLRAFVAQKRKSADKVVSTCAAQDQGLFTRICLETEEGEHHILYSLFWGTRIDVAIVSISGTTKSLWPVYSPVFKEMSSFELIDMKRFEK